ncbi:MAG: hypothetical protein SFV54_02550, partial [Bryobacteraceae bacterium]|nr:hypothetical protein [Bryobacteraceae bacterium]
AGNATLDYINRHQALAHRHLHRDLDQLRALQRDHLEGRVPDDTYNFARPTAPEPQPAPAPEQPPIQPAAPPQNPTEKIAASNLTATQPPSHQPNTSSCRHPQTRRPTPPTPSLYHLTLRRRQTLRKARRHA